MMISKKTRDAADDLKAAASYINLAVLSRDKAAAFELLDKLVHQATELHRLMQSEDGGAR